MPTHKKIIERVILLSKMISIKRALDGTICQWQLENKFKELCYLWFEITAKVKDYKENPVFYCLVVAAL